MSISRLTGFQLVVFFCSNPGITKCLNTLFLLSPYLCFIIGFICDSSVARNDLWMSKKTKQRYVFTILKAEGEGWDPVKLA